MIFSTIVALTHGLQDQYMRLISLMHAPFLLGLIAGGAVIYWFTGASAQAVTTGAYQAVEFIKKNIKLDTTDKASVADSKKVVEICTKYAQKGMFNIFLVVFFTTLSFAFLEPFFFVGYLISIALFGLYQAIFMANAGGAWDNAKKVVEICTKYAQKGMFNIFIAVFFATLSFAFMEPFLFIGYLFGLAIFGLYQAIFMANAGGAWDNAKKVVEVDLKQKGTPLHDAVVIGDTVGDPFKDTSSVAMNPIIKFATLFGLLAVSLAVDLTAKNPLLAHVLTVAFFLVSMFFVRKSFYGMRIESKG
jgi:Na+/H+-translocating membrane pyrophosphatase